MEVFTFPGNKKAKGHNEMEGVSKEEQTREENIIFLIQPVFPVLQANRRAFSYCLGLGSAVKDQCGSVCACGHVCVCAYVCAGVCVRLAYQKVYGSACTGYFFQSCLPAIGVSANFWGFFLKGDIKTRH